MNSSPQLKTAQQTARVGGIIVVALAIGILSLGVFAWLKGTRGGQPGIQSLFAIGFAVVSVILSYFLPIMISNNAIKQLRQKQTEIEDSDLFRVYLNQLIVGAAIVEGPAFYNLLIYIVEGFIGTLITGLFAILIILERFPTEGRVSLWVKRQREQMQLDATSSRSREP